MHISSYLRRESILIFDQSPTQDELYRKLIRVLLKDEHLKKSGVSEASLLESIWERERQSTTALGNGFAFPHFRLQKLKQVVVGLAVIKNGCMFGEKEPKKVQIVCMILCSQDNPTMYLKVMAQMVKILTDSKVTESLKKFVNVDQVFDLIQQANASLDIAITARDIMHQPRLMVYEHTPLKEITEQMNRLHLSSVAVQNKEGGVIGEISCESLFQIGLPEFFSQLKSVSFIDEFDPFERYFEQELSAVAKDVMKPHVKVIPPSATLLEVVFYLVVKRHSAVYIEEKGRLIGEIDQSAVLDRIINI